MITCAMSASYQAPSAMRLRVPYQGCRPSRGAALTSRSNPGYRPVPPELPGEADTQSDNSHKSLGHPDEDTAVPRGEDAARQVYGALTAPVHHQGVEGLDMLVGQCRPGRTQASCPEVQ